MRFPNFKNTFLRGDEKINQKSYIVLIYLLIIAVLGCSRDDDIKQITFSKKSEANDIGKQSGESPLRIAVGGMTSPREGFVYYKKLLNYIGEKLGRKVEFIDREDYGTINRMLMNKEVDVAFVSSGPYVEGHDEFGLELLAAPQVSGSTAYYSYIIVPEDSPVENLKELRGRTFAFTDPLSNSGTLVPIYMLARINEEPGSFFKSSYFTYAHDKSIRAVASGLVDGAAVDSLIWEYENQTDPEFTSKTKIIEKSSPHAIPPVVIRHGIEPALKEKLINVLLNAHKDEKGREILRGMIIDKFVRIDDKSYDSIREMKQWLNKRGEKKG